MNYLQAKAQYNQDRWDDYQESLDDRQEEIIQKTIADSQDSYGKWKAEMQESFSDHFVKINNMIFNECLEDYLEMGTDLYLNDWDRFIKYSIGYIEDKYL
jgi:hypothetical protein